MMSEPVLFWGGIYSQWHCASFVMVSYPYSITVRDYPTAEHFMMCEKAALFGDEETWHKIMATDNPDIAKRLGRQVKGYDEEEWKKVRFQIVCRGNYEKFRQNPDLARELVATGDREIVEASPYDKVWGVGMNEGEALMYWRREDLRSDIPFVTWPGLNLLGEALMVARSMLAPR